MDAEMTGTRAYLDGQDIREGRLAVPRPGQDLAMEIRTAILRLQGSAPRPGPHSGMAQAEADKAQALLDQLVARFRDGKPALATYDYAYEFIFGTRPKPWLARIHPAKVLGYAELTSVQEVGGFGKMRLDTFTVSRGTRKPAHGHWEAGLGNDERAWQRAFKTADLLK